MDRDICAITMSVLVNNRKLMYHIIPGAMTAIYLFHLTDIHIIYSSGLISIDNLQELNKLCRLCWQNQAIDGWFFKAGALL